MATYKWLKLDGFTLLLYGITILVWNAFMNKKEHVEWYEKFNQTNGLISNAKFAIMVEAATNLPMDWALYLITNSANTNAGKIVLAGTGFTCFLHLGGIYAYSKVKKENCWIGCSTAILCSTVLTIFCVVKLIDVTVY